MFNARYLVHSSTGKRVQIVAETIDQYYVEESDTGSTYKLDKSVLALNKWELEKPAIEKQVGGNHYSNLGISPIEIIEANGLDFFEGNAVKYLLRYKEKNGVEDLKKAIWYINYLIKRQSNV